MTIHLFCVTGGLLSYPGLKACVFGRPISTWHPN